MAKVGFFEVTQDGAFIDWTDCAIKDHLPWLLDDLRKHYPKAHTWVIEQPKTSSRKHGRSK